MPHVCIYVLCLFIHIYVYIFMYINYQGINSVFLLVNCRGHHLTIVTRGNGM